MFKRDKISSYLWGFAALALFAVSSSMTLDYGASMGLTEHGKWQGAATTFALHASTLALAALIGSRASWRRIISTIALSCLFVVCAGFSILNLSGYGAKERIEKAMLADAQRAALDKATAAANERVAKERSDLLSWFKQTHVKTKDKTERKDLRKEALEIINKGSKIEVQKVESVMSDPQATVFARITGFDPLAFQIGWWIIAGALMLMLESVFAFYAGKLWPRAVRVETPAKAPPVSDKGGSSSSGNSGPETAKPEAKPADVLPFPKREVAVKGNGLDPDVSATPCYPTEPEISGNALVVTALEPIEWPLEAEKLAEELDTLPTFRELLSRPVPRSEGRETGNARYPKEPEREKKTRKRQTFDELYAKTTSIVTKNGGVMPDARALRRLLAPCQMKRALNVRETWLADDEKQRAVNKPPRARHRGKRLGIGLEELKDMDGYRPQIAAMKLENGHA